MEGDGRIVLDTMMRGLVAQGGVVGGGEVVTNSGCRTSTRSQVIER